MITIDQKYKPELVVSTEPWRPALSGIYVDVEAGVAVASDGAMMLLVPIERSGDADQSGIVPADQYADKTMGGYFGFSIKEGKVHFGNASPLIEKKYPDYKAVIPDRNRPGTVKIGLDAERLWRLVQAMGGRGGCVIHWNPDGKGMHVETDPPDPKVTAVLMPRKLNEVKP